MIKVIVADDHPLLRKGVAQLVETPNDVELAADCGNGRELLELVRKVKCDVVIMDMLMPGMNGLDLIKQIKAEKPRLPVLVLTMFAEDQYAIRALHAGASGYVTKEALGEQLLDAIRKVAGGGKYVSESLAEKLAGRIVEGATAPHEMLSDREYQVMCMIADGKTVSDVAAKLKLSVKTISTYRARVLEKLHLKNNSEITRYAMENHLVK